MMDRDVAKSKLIVLSAALLLIFLTMWSWKSNEHGRFVDVGTDESDHINLVKINGEGLHWKVENYTIAFSQHLIYRGNARLTYLGDEGDVSRAEYFSYKVYEWTGDEERPVHSHYRTARNIGMDIADMHIGSISGAKDDWEQHMYQKRFTGKVYMIVEWKDNYGTRHRERIDLFEPTHLTES